ncbi:MAG: hypothetical protein KJ579_06700 [Verrucomicrobia bacterium]|nr:hypothetical protein [Verrucomicrobiota bacterium]
MSSHFVGPLATHVLVAVAVGAVGLTPSPAAAQSTVSNLLAAFDVVDRVQCDVRRDTEAGARRGRMLSRVSFAKPDRLHVDNISPLPRRIVCDGTNFFSYVEGDPTGFSRPVAELDPAMLFGLHALPGTPMEHLLRLQGRPETNLPPVPGFTRRVRILGPAPQATLAFDAQGRLARLEIYDDPNSSQPMAVWDYAGFIEPAPGVWIPTLHKAVMRMKGGGARETSRFENYRVGATLDPSLFDPARHFRDVVFTNSFDAIYK